MNLQSLLDRLKSRSDLSDLPQTLQIANPESPSAKDSLKGNKRGYKTRKPPTTRVMPNDPEIVQCTDEYVKKLSQVLELVKFLQEMTGQVTQRLSAALDIVRENSQWMFSSLEDQL
jgi:hypothetical protein